MTQLSLALLHEDEAEIVRSFHLDDQFDPLLFCVINRLQTSLRCVLKLLSDQNRQNLTTRSKTALMAAAAVGDLCSAEQLVFQSGRQSSRGQTALMIAAMYNRPDMCRLLAQFEAGMQTSEDWLRIKAGSTALTIAAAYKSKAAFEVLVVHELCDCGEQVMEIAEKNNWVTDDGFNTGKKILVGTDALIEAGEEIKRLRAEIQRLSADKEQRTDATVQYSNVKESQKAKEDEMIFKAADSKFTNEQEDKNDEIQQVEAVKAVSQQRQQLQDQLKQYSSQSSEKSPKKPYVLNEPPLHAKDLLFSNFKNEEEPLVKYETVTESNIMLIDSMTLLHKEECLLSRKQKRQLKKAQQMQMQSTMQVSAVESDRPEVELIEMVQQESQQQVQQATTLTKTQQEPIDIDPPKQTNTSQVRRISNIRKKSSTAKIIQKHSKK